MVQDLKIGTPLAAWGVLPASIASSRRRPTYKPLAYIDPELDELGFNCYTGPSLGNPVLKDWKFRQALHWASTTTRSCRSPTAASPCRPRRPGLELFTVPDWHWQPPPTDVHASTWPRPSRCSTPPAIGTRTATASNKGKPIVLRLGPLESALSQSAGKLIAGWFHSLGLKIKLSVAGRGALDDGIYNTRNGTFTAELRHVPLGLGPRPRPRLHPGLFTTAQIKAGATASGPTRSTTSCSSSRSDDRPERGKPIVDQMQQILYQQSPTSRPPTRRGRGLQRRGLARLGEHAGRGRGVFFTRR